MSSYDDYRATKDMEIEDRLRELQDMGFRSMFAMDIRVGDIIVKTPDRIDFAYSWTPGMMIVVTRVLPVDASYFDPDENEHIYNVVIHFVGEDENGLEREFGFGHTHAFHIYRPN